MNCSFAKRAKARPWFLQERNSEAATPDLEQNVFQIGGCGLWKRGLAVCAFGELQVTASQSFGSRRTRDRNPRLGAHDVPDRGLQSP